MSWSGQKASTAWSPCAVVAAWQPGRCSSWRADRHGMPSKAGDAQMEYEDVLYEIDGPVAVVTINRPGRLNAFRARTIEELIHAFKRAWADESVRSIILT